MLDEEEQEEQPQPVTPPAAARSSALPPTLTTKKTASRRGSKAMAPKGLILEDGYSDSPDDEERPRRRGKRLFHVRMVRGSQEQMSKPHPELVNEGYDD